MKKDIFRVFIANLIKMLSAVITAFFIPMILSVEQYGYLKLFQFYVTYLGISHLGYCDGIYLEYGGIETGKISGSKIAAERNTLLLYEMGIAVLFLIIGFLNRNFIAFFLGLSVIPTVLFTFYTYVYQAVGELKKYTRIMNASTIMNLLFHLGLILNGIADYRMYIAAHCVLQWLSFLIGAYSFRKNGWMGVGGFSASVFYKFVKMGILLMIGNFAYAMFLGIDKWFIKFTMDIKDFSLYSFSAQMLTVVNMFISPVAMTLYSNISRRKDRSFEIRIRKVLLVILMSVPIAVYVLEFIINKFIAQYIGAARIMSVLMIAQIFLVFNTAVFVNLYKAYHRQRDYFIRICLSLVIAFVLDLVVAVKNPNVTGYAFATMISCITWLVLNVGCFSYMIPKGKEIAFVALLLGVYIGTGRCHLWIRMLLYGAAYIILIKLCMNEVWMYFVGQIKAIVNKKRFKSHRSCV